jgi:hypothetical protein
MTWGNKGGIISPLVDNALLIVALVFLAQYPVKMIKGNENLTI